MLEPVARHLFTDGLRPPSGYRVDVAVGTTYSLSLSTLLLPPLAMAAHDHQEADEDTSTAEEGEKETSLSGIALLEAVRRFADRMTVFCHAGAVHVPARYRRILTFAEDAVVEALPQTPGRIFHPKVWVLRFTDGYHHRHRLLVLSRNLTEDTSWDTVVQLEESGTERGIDAAPAADFLEALPQLAVHPVDGERAEQLHDLAGGLRAVRFAPPDPFAWGQLWPMGVGTDHGWPVHEGARSAIVISPFLDNSTVQRVRPREQRVFVSRPETYAEIGAAAFQNADVRVLDPLAETTLEPTPGSGSLPWEIRSGLHAKVIVWDYDGSGWCLTGSANATQAAFDGNVEFSVLLRGVARQCGVTALLPPEQPKGQLSLADVLVPHTIANDDPEENPSYAAELAAGDYHATLVKAGPVLNVTPLGTEDRYDVGLTFATQPPSSPGNTTVRLLSRTGEQHARVIDGEPAWRDVGALDLTPFVVVRTVIPVEGRPEPAAYEAVIKAELHGAPADRAAKLLRTLLDTEESVLRYLSFLLDEGGGDALTLWHGKAEDGTRPGPTRPTFDDVTLLETMVRAAARGDESLHRVHALLKDLGADGERSTLLPEEFLSIWDAVWSAANGQGATR